MLLIERGHRGKPPQLQIAYGDGSEHELPGFFEPFATKAKGNNANVVCPQCGTVLPGNAKNPRTSTQIAAQKGGADVVFDDNGKRSGGAFLLAVVTQFPGERGRRYRLPTEKDYAVVFEAQLRLKRLLGDANQDGSAPLCPVPDEATPIGGGSGAGRAFSVQRYGMRRWRDLFTARQLLTLATAEAVLPRLTNDPVLSEAVALAISRWTDIFNASCRWESSKTQVRNLFARQALPILWDFAENALSTQQAGDLSVTINTMAEVIEVLRCIDHPAQIFQSPAQASPLPDEAADLWFTDPPYYDAVPYADLSDFFFVWLKRALPGHSLLKDPSDAANVLTPKVAEAVQDETKLVDGRPKDKAFFEHVMTLAFAEGRRITREDGIASVVFAHKTTEGWEALLGGITKGGWVITASWPIVTESATRLRARDSAALATSVHLICRPRPDDAPVGDWAEILRALPRRVGEWMERLQSEGVRGADLVFACIGPALEIFSRYSRVETAEGSEVALAGYLEKVWEIVGRSALEQILGTAEARARNGAAGALEEDARLTALFLWTLESTNGDVSEEESEDQGTAGDEDADDEGGETGKAKGFSLVFDVVRRFAQPLGIELPNWEKRIIETDKGVVRLLPIAERAKQLFGEDGGDAMAAHLEMTTALGPNPLQGMLFPEMEVKPAVRGRGTSKRGRNLGLSSADVTLSADRAATTLDRVHAAMLLQAAGRTNALRALLQSEQERGQDFLRLANALAALYPKGSEEKRLLEAMLLAAPR